MMRSHISQQHAYTPNVQGPSSALALARVVAIRNADPLSGYPENVNVAVAFTYDVDLQSPNGQVRLNQCKVEAADGWPYPYLVRAHAVGSLVRGEICDSRFRIFTVERVFSAPCSFTPGGA